MREVARAELISFISETISGIDLPPQERAALKNTLRSYVQAIPPNKTSGQIAINVHGAYHKKVKGYGAHDHREFTKWVTEEYDG